VVLQEFILFFFHPLKVKKLILQKLALKKIAPLKYGEIILIIQKFTHLNLIKKKLLMLKKID